MTERVRVRHEDAIRELRQRGARFVRCRDKRPIEKPGWQRRRLAAEDAIAHLRAPGGELGIMPMSLDCAVVDVDGRSASQTASDEVRQEVRQCNQDLTAAIRAWLGEAGYLGCLPSVSNVRAQSGKYHIWYAVDAFSGAPLGRKADGKPYRLSPSGMLFEGEGTGYDIRYDGYVLCHQYIESLAYCTRPARARARATSWRLKELIPHGMRHRPDSAAAPHPESHALFGDGDGDGDGERARDGSEAAA